MIKGAVFTVAETHGRVLRPGNRLISHSPNAGWRALYAATYLPRWALALMGKLKGVLK